MNGNFSGHTAKNLLICAIGDSRTVGAGASAGADPLSLLADMLRSRFPSKSIAMNNQAINGTTAHFWLYDQACELALRSFRESAALSPIGTKVIVQIMLGVNDAGGHARLSVATYLSCMQALVERIRQAAIPGFSGIVLHTSFFAVPFGFSPAIDDLCLSLVQQYNSLLPSLADGRTVFIGDQISYDYFEKHPDLLFDKLHTSDQGNAELARLWSYAYDPIITALAPDLEAADTITFS